MADVRTKNKQLSKSLFRRIVLWLAVVVTVLSLLAVAAGLLVENFLNSPDIKNKIQQQAAADGITLDYQKIGICYYPLPEIQLIGVIFTLPEGIHGSVGAVSILPDFSGLLAGGLPGGRIELVRPALSITLQKWQTADKSPDKAEQKNNSPTLSLAGLSLSNFDLVINDGRISFHSGDKKLEVEGVALSLRLSLSDAEQITVDLTATLVHPALGLSGSLSWTGKGMRLDLVGRDIDVEATRAATLGIADTITPLTKIFTYLTGGNVPEIHFVAEGANFADLGAYANFHLDGQLREGKVEVPEIGLELTGVEGEIHLVDGVLRGEQVSARLGLCTGNSGTLALGLAEGSDLFQLDLLVKADLAEGKDFAKRLVDNPRFTGVIDRITQLEGTGAGRLVLGDSFSNLQAKVESADLQVTLSHSALPHAVKIDSGRLDFVGDGITVRGLHGSFGGSTFSGLALRLGWQQGLQVDVGFKESHLALDELFPWVSKLEGLKSRLAVVTSVTGTVNLNEARFKGAIDQPESWAYGAVGEMADVVAVAPAFPGEIAIARSAFTLDEQSITLLKTNLTALDGDLQLQGTIRDWRSVDFGVNGTLGPEIVAWLEKTLAVAAGDGIRPPISLTNSRLILGNNGESGFSGNVTFATGPELTLAVKVGKKGVHLEQLKVKGVGNDLAELKVISSNSGTDVGFSGTLGNETLAALFVNPLAGKGFLDGDIEMKIPTAAKSMATARGHLNGSELLLPLAGEETLRIGRIALQAEDAKFRTEINDLVWRTYNFNTVQGTVDVHHDKITATVDSAQLCGISVAGKGSYGDEMVDVAVDLNAKNLDFAKTYTCLTQSMADLSGSMAAVGRISTAGRTEKLLANLEGPLKIRIINGVIKKGLAIAPILEVLNVTEVVKGRLPKLSSDGLPYRTIELHGRFGDKRYTFDKILMDGETLNLIGQGFIDLEQGTLKVELLAAPLETVDATLKYIPGARYLTEGNLVTIPLSVTGSLENPRVVVLSSSTVSKSLLKLGARILKMPFKLLQ